MGAAKRSDLAQGPIEAKIPGWIGRELSESGDQLAVPVDFAGAVAGRKEKGEVEGGGSVRREDEVASIPGKAGVVAMALGLPWAAGKDPLPGGVVERRIAPGCVVAGVKLPWAIERERGAAETFQDELGWRSSGGLGAGVLQGWKERKERERRPGD